MWRAKTELTRPSTPVSGHTLRNLRLVLESVVGDGEVRELDLAMLLNVPANRLGRLKKSGAPAGEPANEGPEAAEEDDNEEAAVIRPSQAVLVRLLLRYPQYAPLPLRPSNAEMFDLIVPLLEDDGRSVKQKYAPLFGRSYISSYKMLSEDEVTSLPVVRLQMLMVGCLAEVFRELCYRFVRQFPAEVPEQVLVTLRHESGWHLLRVRDSLTDWMPDHLYDEFCIRLHEQWCTWFQERYLQVLRDEAVSRNLDPEKALTRGNWTNREEVSPEELRRYSRHTQPILGCEDSLFSIFRESFGLTSAEAFWTLGLQIKAYYRFRQRARQRIDAPSAILIRYLFRYPEDLRHLLPQPPAGEEVLRAIRMEDPDFRTSHLGPLFGASRVMSYEFAADRQSCPFFARRLATIFMEQQRRGQPIYTQLRECVEDEVKARGIDLETFWRDGRWSPDIPSPSSLLPEMP